MILWNPVCGRFVKLWFWGTQSVVTSLNYDSVEPSLWQIRKTMILRNPVCGRFVEIWFWGTQSVVASLKGVFAKNERGYMLNAIKKRFWSLLILLLSVASIRRKLIKTSHIGMLTFLFYRKTIVSLWKRRRKTFLKTIVFLKSSFFLNSRF